MMDTYNEKETSVSCCLCKNSGKSNKFISFYKVIQDDSTDEVFNTYIQRPVSTPSHLFSCPNKEHPDILCQDSVILIKVSQFFNFPLLAITNILNTCCTIICKHVFLYSRIVYKNS